MACSAILRFFTRRQCKGLQKGKKKGIMHLDCLAAWPSCIPGGSDRPEGTAKRQLWPWAVPAAGISQGAVSESISQGLGACALQPPACTHPCIASPSPRAACPWGPICQSWWGQSRTLSQSQAGTCLPQH